MRRRHFLYGLGACGLGLTLPFFALRGSHAASSWEEDRVRSQLEALEVHAGGRLGVALFQQSRGELFNHRGGQRFPLCSTFKVLLAGAVLHKSLYEPHLLSTPIDLKAEDMLPHSPVCQAAINKSLTVQALCIAALTESDNAATNLLLDVVGGPQALRSFVWSSLGDHIFRLDRREPDVNNVSPRDVRDSTTPTAMAASVGSLVLGENILPAAERRMLVQWLKDTKTGTARIRAGVPRNWQVGNRSGTGPYGITNDVALLWPPEGEPYVLALYYMQEDPQADIKEELLAEVAQLLCGYRW